MSLMETMRRGTESGAMKVVLAIIVLVFVFWGIGTGGAPTSQLVAEVNGERITDTTYHNEMRSRIRSQGRSISEEEQKVVAHQVLNQLIMRELMRQQAHDLGLEISDEEIARYILQYSVFKDEDGKFSPKLYKRHLQRIGTKEGKFEEDLRAQLTQAKLIDLLLRAVDVRASEVQEYWRASKTKLTLEFVRLTALNFYDDVNPDATELLTFITEQQPAITTWYEEHFESRYHKPARAQVRMIFFAKADGGSDEAALVERMESIRQQIASGADFADMARRYSEDLNAVNGGNMGLMAHNQLDPVLADAVFGINDELLAEPGLRPIVTTTQGVHLVQVEAILPEETIPEEDVREEIARTLLQEQQAPVLAGEFAERLRSTWKESGQAPLDMLLEQDLKVTEVGPITLADERVPELRELPELMDKLADVQAGEVLDEVHTTDGAWFIIRVKDRQTPDDTLFELDKDQVAARLKMMRQAEFIQDWQDDLVGRADVKRYLRL